MSWFPCSTRKLCDMTRKSDHSDDKFILNLSNFILLKWCLFSSGARVNTKDSKWMTPLHRACASGSVVCSLHPKSDKHLISPNSITLNQTLR